MRGIISSFLVGLTDKTSSTLISVWTGFFVSLGF